MMPGLPELLVVLLIILVLFGAGKLPQVFEAMGTGIKKFREAQADDDDESEDVTRPPAAKKEIAEKAPVDAEEVENKQAAS